MDRTSRTSRSTTTNAAEEALLDLAARQNARSGSLRAEPRAVAPGAHRRREERGTFDDLCLEEIVPIVQELVWIHVEEVA